MHKKAFYIFFLLLYASCATWKPYHQNGGPTRALTGSSVNHSIFFYGGAMETSSKLTDHLKEALLEEQQNTTVILTGNLTGKRGLPDSVSRHYAASRKNLVNHLNNLSGFKGKVIFVPGYKEWASGGRDGYQRVLNLERYLNDHPLSVQTFFGESGCPGPEEIPLNEEVIVVTINTQWYLHGWSKPYDTEGCSLEEESDLLLNLDEVLKRNAHKKIIIAASHPIFSNGRYGGHYPLASHLAPPIIGSLQVLNRKFIGEKPDLSNPDYRQLRKSLRRILRQYPNAIYLAGHEPSLQYHREQEQHYLVSGAIGQGQKVAPGKKARFAYPGGGYGKLTFHENGEVWVEFFALENNEVVLAFRELLYEKPYEPLPDLYERYRELDFQGDSAKTTANLGFKRKAKKPWLFGKNYRPEWTEELTVPVIDLGKEKGGLRIIKKGGGAQTYSLRLQDPTGKQWVLRSIQKYPDKALENDLHGTFYSDILKDQVSASHPYSAIIVPKMADAAGIYHTNPTLVYLPDDPRLGVFREQMGGAIYLFEERPDENWEDQPSFGRSKNIVSSNTVLKKLTNGDHNLVDQKLAVKSRLFDLLLGDWDRHEDQWRWASFKDEGRVFYQPIPRDRDQVFYDNDGAIVKIGSRKWISPKIRGFHHHIKFPERLAGNGIYFDRTFLNQLERKDWLEASRQIREGLTDQVIADALHQWPDNIYRHSGEKIADKLRQRRNDLDQYAERYYRFLAKEVDVVGTKKRDLFQVERLNDAETRVRVFRINKKKEIKFKTYERVFLTGETKEIRLFGLGKEDHFELTGTVKKGPKIRIIGGDGNDVVTDSSRVRKGTRKNIVYDLPEGIRLNENRELKKRLSHDPLVNNYNRKSFQYNKLYPLIFTESNPDDGLFIGGGLGWIKQGFRQNPAERHVVRADVAPKSRSFNFNYSLFLADIWKQWDITTNLAVSEPSFSDFFYGFGNRTARRDAQGQFYRVRYSQWILHPTLSNQFGSNKQHRFGIGLRYRSVKIRTGDNESDTERFILNYDPQLLAAGSLLDRRRNYLGTTFNYSLDTRNNPNLPSRGFRWNMNSALVWQLGDEQFNYQQVEGNFSFYLGSGGPFNPVLAMRIGGTANFGDFQFFQAARLGGTNNLRGLRKFRFAGDESIYQNTEFRIKVFNFRSKLFPGDVGISAFHDIGRVWSDQTDEELTDPTLSDWHRGYGGGIWISPLGGPAITTEFTRSADNNNLLIYLRLGFMF